MKITIQGFHQVKRALGEKLKKKEKKLAKG